VRLDYRAPIPRDEDGGKNWVVQAGPPKGPRQDCRPRALALRGCAQAAETFRRHGRVRTKHRFGKRSSNLLAIGSTDGALSHLEAFGDFIASMNCVTFWAPAAPKCHSLRPKHPVAAARWVGADGTAERAASVPMARTPVVSQTQGALLREA